MKKIILYFILLFIPIFCFSTNYIIIKDTRGYDGDGNYSCVIYKNSIVTIPDFYIYDGLTSINDFSTGVYVKYNNSDILIDLESIIPAETKDLFQNNIRYSFLKSNNKYLTNIEYCDVLFSKNRNTYYNLHKEEIDYYENRRGRFDDPWYEDETIVPSVIENISITLYANSEVNLYVKKINKIKNGYKVLTEVFRVNSQDWDNNSAYFNKLFIPESEMIIDIIIDGDYINFYTEKNELIVSTIIVDEEFVNQYENLLRTNKCDLSRITWPRHADGTCDYDENNKTTKSQEVSTKSSATTTPSTNVAVNKTMTAYENLKLRSAEATSSSVITVMSSGTKVKVLQLGKPEKIDGIDSNWVKVEVQKGAKDCDGKEIKEGTVGWCYGGYLKDTTTTDSVKKKKKK